MTSPDYPKFDCNDHACATTTPIHAFGDARAEVCFLLETGSTSPTKRQSDVLEQFNKLSHAALVERIAHHACRYYYQIDSIVNLDDEGIIVDLEHIDRHYRFSDLTIPQHSVCDTDFVLIMADCDWEEEHGMLIMLMDGEIVYCGDHVLFFDGPRWQYVISAPSREEQIDLLNALLTSSTRP